MNSVVFRSLVNVNIKFSFFITGNRNEILNGDIVSERYSLSLPGSPTEHKQFKGVIGSAESLVGRVRL